jgi:hypothetical protein
MRKIDGQTKWIKDLAAKAVDRAIAEGLLDEVNLQRLVYNGDEFQKGIIHIMRGLSMSNLFADEEVKSSHGYHFGYSKPKSITEQIAILGQFFPDIGSANEKIAEQTLPQKAEGWFAIPRWQSVGKTYNEALKVVLDLIRKQRMENFCNYREGQIGEEYLREFESTKRSWEKLGKTQKGYDILVVAAQFGYCSRGFSPRRAREVFMASEFGLGAFEIGCMLITHPERLMDDLDLGMYCIGDECSSRGEGDFASVPCFRLGALRRDILFSSEWIGNTLAGYGSPSAFLP